MDDLVTDFDVLVDKVSDKVHGTKSDPLTREEVERVVKATLDVLEEQREAAGPTKEPQS